jgi:hypothetical protein
VRAAFDRVLAQAQERSQRLLRVQSEILAVLDEAAAATAPALGGLAPNVAEMPRVVLEAMRNASRRVTAAVDGMRQRRPTCVRRPDGDGHHRGGGTTTPLAGVDQGSLDRSGRRGQG